MQELFNERRKFIWNNPKYHRFIGDVVRSLQNVPDRYPHRKRDISTVDGYVKPFDTVGSRLDCGTGSNYHQSCGKPRHKYCE